MIDKTTAEHHIQKHILGVLMHQRIARFRDLRPPRIDSNLYSYHLKLLIKRGLVKKTESGYILDTKGLQYADTVNKTSVSNTVQPKIITMTILQNGHGGILLYEKLSQPLIGLWTLPHGKVHRDDASLALAAQRELHEKIGDNNVRLTHAGDCYIRLCHEGEIVLTTLAHIFYGATDEHVASDHLRWVGPRELQNYNLAPAIEQIIARTFFRDPYFFEEYTEELVQ